MRLYYHRNLLPSPFIVSESFRLRQKITQKKVEEIKNKIKFCFFQRRTFEP